MFISISICHSFSSHSGAHLHSSFQIASHRLKYWNFEDKPRYCGSTLLLPRCHFGLKQNQPDGPQASPNSSTIATSKVELPETTTEPEVQKAALPVLKKIPTDENFEDEQFRIDEESFVEQHSVTVYQHGVPSLLLAHKWDGGDPTGYWISEKLDGVRCFWTGSKFISRQGNQYYAPPSFTKDLPKHVQLDGELWCGRQMFRATVSIVKTAANAKSSLWDKISYRIFDSPSLGKLPFEDRINLLYKYFKHEKLKHVTVIEHELCEGEHHIKKRLQEVEDLKGEGLMLRMPKSLYEPTRSQTLLKVKNFFDSEAKVIGHEQGHGRFEGKVGALICELPNGKKVKLGSGLNDDERKKPPPVGTIVTYRYQELTPGGIPRFPTFVGVKPDAQWPPSDTEIQGIKVTSETPIIPKATNNYPAFDPNQKQLETTEKQPKVRKKRPPFDQ